MITITYKICYEPPYIFRTYEQMKEIIGIDKITYDAITLAKDELIIKIMGLQLNGTSVQLSGVSNPLTQLKQSGKLYLSGR